jgi:hypothetical protein
MHNKKVKYILLTMLFCLSAGHCFCTIAGATNPNITRPTGIQTGLSAEIPPLPTLQKGLTGDQEIDEERKKEEKRQGFGPIFTSKFIKVTNERLLTDSTQVFR